MDAHALLLCWERGRRRHTLDRALLLHAAAAPDADAESLADRPLGERNAALLRLRRALFGDELASCLECPACGERLEFSLSAATLAGRAPSSATHVWVDGWHVRMPTTRDLASVAGEADDAAASGMLLDRLIDDDAAAVARLTSVRSDRVSAAPLAERIAEALDAADPCLDISIDVTCLDCAHEWNAPLDVVDFVWREIELRARRLLDEVHVLASAYGWTEADILRMSDARRDAYVERALA